MSKNIDQYRIAIIGPNDVVSGFKVLGVESFVAHDSEEVVLKIKKIKHYGLHLIGNISNHCYTLLLG